MSGRPSVWLASLLACSAPSASAAFEADAAGAYAEARALLAQAQPGGTGFDRLEALFNAGTKPSPGELRGWFAGKMFVQGTPNTPETALLIGDEVEEIPNGGPLFTKTLKLVMHYRLPLDDATMQKLAREFPGYSAGFSTPDFTAAGGVRFHRGPDKLELRRNGNYFILKYSWQDQDPRQSGAYAYLYEDVSPNKARYLPEPGKP